MTSRFLSGDNGTGGHLHDFPSLSGRTALYTRAGWGCNGQSPRAPRLPRVSRPGLGCPIFGGSCAILIHGLDQCFDRPEDLVAPKPLHKARDKPLPVERFASGVIGEVYFDPNRTGSEGARAPDVGETVARPAQESILRYVDPGSGQELLRVDLEVRGRIAELLAAPRSGADP